MANHQIACLASQNANDEGFVEIWQLNSRDFSFPRQKNAVFSVKSRFSFDLIGLALARCTVIRFAVVRTVIADTGA
jgi:hypothetical protein